MMENERLCYGNDTAIRICDDHQNLGRFSMELEQLRPTRDRTKIEEDFDDYCRYDCNDHILSSVLNKLEHLLQILTAPTCWFAATLNFYCCLCAMYEEDKTLFVWRPGDQQVLHYAHTSFIALVTIIVLYDSIHAGHRSFEKRQKSERMKNDTITTRKRKSKRIHFDLRFISVTLIYFVIGIALIPYFIWNGIFDRYLYRLISSSGGIIIVTTDLPSNTEMASYLSFTELFVIHTTNITRKIVSTSLQRKTKTYTLLLSTHIAKVALSHPFLFHVRVRQTILLIRWAKYLGPIFGTCNKLKGHIEDGIRKWKLKERTMRIFKSWQRLLKTVRQKNELEQAVRRIQYSFRLRRKERAERKLRFMSLTEGDRRRRAADVYARIEQRWANEFTTAEVGIALAEKVEQERLLRRQVTERDKKQIISCSRKIKTSSLLIPPNVLFSIVWRCLAIFCVIIEVSNLVLIPRAQRTDHISLYDLMRSIRIPRQQRTFCQRQEQESRNLWKIVPSWLIQFRFDRATSNTLSQCTEPDMYALSDVMIGILLRFNHSLQPLIAFVSFTDVFITFFTGEIDGVTLRSKPFISRWIFPGLLLQVLVNPTLKYIGILLYQMIQFLVRFGPGQLFCTSYLISRSFSISNKDL